MTKSPRILRLGPAELRIFHTDNVLFAAAADEFLRVTASSLSARGACDIALAGGSTPRQLYSLVAARGADLDWSRVHFFFGDERCVPPDHPESNYRMVRESLFSSAELARAHVHRMHGELSPTEAAARYEQELRSHFLGSARPQPAPAVPPAGFPRFDLILLGLGPDGHTASLFPETTALHENERWAVANWVEKFGASRLTLTYPVLDNAAEVMFLVTGAAKRDALHRIFRAHEPLPAAAVHPVGKLLWFLDKAAAADLQP